MNSVTILNTNTMLSCISVIILLFSETNKLKFIIDEENGILKVLFSLNNQYFFTLIRVLRNVLGKLLVFLF